MYSLLLAYDGTHYFGWQKTKTGPSIQETLEKAIFQVTREEAIPEAASRTDRGVHAEGQAAAFSLKSEWEPRRLLKALNAVLPPDIRVLSVEKKEPTFHPTLQAKGKEYHYRICQGLAQEPQFRLYSWHYRYNLDLSSMQKAAKYFIGTQDFSALANEREDTPFCTLHSIDFTTLQNNRLQISLRGDRFLYKMARNLAGTLLYIGSGKIPLDLAEKLLASRDRRLAGVTAPAHALFLHRVDY